MTAGLQIFNEGGGLFWDTDMFACRSFGQAAVGYGTGTIVDARFSTGTPWCIPLIEGNRNFNSADPAYGHLNVNDWLTTPNIVFNGNTLYWTRPANPMPAYWGSPTCTLYYGVY